MHRNVFAALLVVLSLSASAFALPTIIAGHHTINPEQAGQAVTITITPGDPGDNPENPSGGLDGNTQTISAAFTALSTEAGGPIITNIDLISAGLIFAPNNTGIQPLPPFDPPARNVGASTTTNSGEILADGNLAIVTLSTVGVAPGVYGFYLWMDDIDLGLTVSDVGVLPEFDPDGGNAAFLVHGTITVTPEPSTMVMSLMGVVGIGAVAVRRYRGRKAA